MTDTAMKIWREAFLAYGQAATVDPIPDRPGTYTVNSDAGDEAAAAVIARRIPQGGDGPAPYTCKHGCERDGMMDRIAQLEARCERMAGALVDHNDRLRSAQAIAQRDGADTNWLAFRGQVTFTLAEHHDLVNEARQALEKDAS